MTRARDVNPPSRARLIAERRTCHFLRFAALVTLLPLAESLADSVAGTDLIFAVKDAFSAVAKAASPLTNSLLAIVDLCPALEASVNPSGESVRV